MSTSSFIRKAMIIKSNKNPSFSVSLSMQPKTKSRPPSAKLSFPSTTISKVYKCKRSILNIRLGSLTSENCGSFVLNITMKNGKRCILYFTTFGERLSNWSTQKSWLTPKQTSEITILLLTSLLFTTWKLKKKPNASKTSFSTLPLLSFHFPFAKSVCTFYYKLRLRQRSVDGGRRPDWMTIIFWYSCINNNYDKFDKNQ